MHHAGNSGLSNHFQMTYRDVSLSLHLGDSLCAVLFEGGDFDLTVTSPPYNVGLNYNQVDDGSSYEQYLEFNRQWLSNCLKWSKPGGRLCLNIPLDKNRNGQHSVCADLTVLAQQVGWRYHTTIIWNEGNISRRTAWGSWMSPSAPYVIAPVEVIVVLYKDFWKRKSPRPSDIRRDEFLLWTNGLWVFNGESKKRVGHPAPFPRELPRRCIKLFSFVGDTVFDPFCGSGTTLLEAAELGRNAVGVEIDSTYFDLAKNRLLKSLNSNATQAELVSTAGGEAEK